MLRPTRPRGPLLPSSSSELLSRSSGLVEHDKRLPDGVHNRFRKCTGVLQFAKLVSMKGNRTADVRTARAHRTLLNRRGTPRMWGNREASSRLG
jgi:hypothetical protein